MLLTLEPNAYLYAFWLLFFFRLFANLIRKTWTLKLGHSKIFFDFSRFCSIFPDFSRFFPIIRSGPAPDRIIRPDNPAGPDYPVRAGPRPENPGSGPAGLQKSRFGSSLIKSMLVLYVAFLLYFLFEFCNLN